MTGYFYIATAALRNPGWGWQLDGPIRIKRMAFTPENGKLFILGGLFPTVQSCARAMRLDLRSKFGIKGRMGVVLELEAA